MPKTTQDKLKKPQTKYTFNDLNRDLIELDCFCEENDIKIKDRIELLKPITSKIPKKPLSRSTLLYWLMFLGAIGLVVIIVRKNWEPISWHIAAATRITMIKVLPYYDWKYLKDERCLIPKWFSSSTKKLDEVFDCDLCESFRDFNDFFVALNENNSPDIVRQFIDLDRPILIPGVIGYWITKSPEDFVGQLLDHKEFSFSFPCNLETNIHNNKRDDIDLQDLFEKIPSFGSFFLHFQNCDKEAMRVFRNYTYRPSIVPEEIAPVSYNWLIWNKNYSPTKYKKLNLIEKHTVVGQLFGSTALRLIPRKNCAEICETIEGVLPAGYILIFTSLWDLEYLPQGDEDNMAVILEIR
ncbi:uncharacterized protein [Euwallacea similis]|uniref:uncharacterized protein n=1 Tax=Euwallacea similis TaxID=1736056 RepID=UPI00344CDB1A